MESPQDGIDYLRAQHDEMKRLFRDFAMTTSNDKRLEVLRDLTAVLSKHAAIEEVKRHWSNSRPF